MALGIIAPGGSKSAFKGALIGGSATSAFYLIKDPNAAAGQRGFAHLVTNTLLGTGVFWTICDCSGGAWSGALIGGGGTALIQSFGTRNRSLAKLGGTAEATPPSTPATSGSPATPNTPGAGTPAVAGQTQTAPAQAGNPPAQQASSAPTQNAPAASAPGQTQNYQIQPQAAVQAPNAPVQTQGVQATQTQSAPAAAQGVPPQVQALPPLDPEDLIFSTNSVNSNGGDRDSKIGSVAPQTTLPKP